MSGFGSNIILMKNFNSWSINEKYYLTAFLWK